MNKKNYFYNDIENMFGHELIYKYLYIFYINVGIPYTI